MIEAIIVGYLRHGRLPGGGARQLLTSGMEALQPYKSNRCKFKGLAKVIFQLFQADACCLAELGYRQ